MRRISLVDALAAMQAVCEPSSHTWIGSVDVPTAVLVLRLPTFARLRDTPAGVRG
jgi:3-oxoadipate enol-lactonase